MTDSLPQDPHAASQEIAARPAARPRAIRIYTALLTGACVVALVVAARLEPSPNGYGTHMQLGFGPCGVLLMTGYPCPTCGMTTAFALTVHGHWLRAFLTQPAGFVFAVATLLAAGTGTWSTVAGRWPRGFLWRLNPYWLFLGLLMLLLGSWAFKIVLGLVQGVLPAR